MRSLIQKSSLGYWFSKEVRVRYAPSPTGPMHLGAARTALFNYLYAQKNQGKFILRIQDTDNDRNVKDGAQHIYQTLKWLGITPHQSFMSSNGKYGPYVQSERLSLYREIQEALMRNGYAYPCFCQNKERIKNSETTQYDGTCRKLSLGDIKNKIKSGQKYVVRIKSDIEQLRIQSFKDLNYGDVKASPFDDFIIVKSNGLPTYHFANVIDDWKMNITHVIRGAQWLTNTPKHIYLYKILGVKVPNFLHLPLLFTMEGKKLSKRDPTAPLDNLKAEGYLPEAIVNYTGLLCFRPEEKLKSEFLNLEQLVQAFEEDNLTNSPIKSDQKKLNFFNRHYLKQKWKKKDAQFIQKMRQYLRDFHNVSNSDFSDEYLDRVLDCVIDRVNKPSEFKQFDFFFKPPKYSHPDTIKDVQKLFGKQTIANYDEISQTFELVGYDPNIFAKNQLILHNLLLIFEQIISPEEYNEITISKRISEFLYDNSSSIKNEDVYHLLRLAVIGRKSGPNIVGICELFGRERVVQGLNRIKTIFVKKGKKQLL